MGRGPAEPPAEPPAAAGRPAPATPVVRLPQRCPFDDCGHLFSVPATEHGRSISCPACGRSLTVLHPDTPLRHDAERRRLAAALRARRAGVPAPRAPDAGRIALLENVRSLWNVGSIFRSADGAGFARLLLAGITGRPPRAEITRTALGAEQVVAWEQLPDPLAAARRARAAGYRLIALEVGEGALPASAIEVAHPFCLIVGHEVAGVSGALCALADQRLALPMRGVKASLNVAVAFGVAAYQLAEAREALPVARRRRPEPWPPPVGKP